MEKNILLNILQCPKCARKLDSELSCLQCKRTYKREDCIYELICDLQLPLPSAYLDKDYLRYHKVSPETDEYFYHNNNPIINWVNSSGYREIIKILSKDDGLVLECGCGAGAFLNFYPDIDFNKYIMLDFDREALKLVNKRESVKGVIHGDSYKLPFVNSCFDTVISNAHLEHLLFLDLALDEIRRILKPGGRFIVSVPAEGGFLWSMGRLFTSARYFSTKLGIDYIKANRIDHCNTIHQIERALKRYFSVKKRKLFPFFIPSFNFNLTCTYLLEPLNK